MGGGGRGVWVGSGTGYLGLWMDVLTRFLLVGGGAGDGDVGAAVVLLLVWVRVRGRRSETGVAYAEKYRPLPISSVMKTSSWVATSRRAWARS